MNKKKRNTHTHTRNWTVCSTKKAIYLHDEYNNKKITKTIYDENDQRLFFQSSEETTKKKQFTNEQQEEKH